MDFGYLIFSAKSDQANYNRLAEILAISIKKTQSAGYNNVAIVTNDIKDLDKSCFDEVIEWGDETFWNGRSWMDKLTPFKNTVCLDADMLFLEDYSYWIDFLVENCDLYIPSDAYNIKNQKINNDYYRKTFTANKLPNLYSFFTFFKKDKEICNEFFTLGRYIIKNPIEFSNLYLNKKKPKVLGTDEAFALSAKLLGIEKEISFDLKFPRIVHMKPYVQNWSYHSEKVSDIVGFYFDHENMKLKIGSHQQHNIIHYVEKDLIDDKTLHELKKRLQEKNEPVN